MNKIHNIIWSTAQNAWVVVSEGTKSRSKSGVSVLKIMAALLLLSPAGAMAATLPQGGVITVGDGAIVGSGANQIIIKQNSDKLGINWQSFNVGPDGHVIFDQPGKNSIALNRVIGSDGSSILGKIDANGQVFLINPNGVIFGKDAKVNVGGLVTSTMDITDADFKNGNYKFAANGINGEIVNNGSLHAAEGGYIALLGKTVKNNGLIKAQMGSAVLAAGDAVTLDFSGDGLINVQVAKSAVKALVDNHGVIQADGGSVLMTARATNAVMDTVVNNDGVIQAQTINNQAGRIFLDGGPFDGTGTVSVAGTLDASAPTTGKGGFIETSGVNVKIAKDVKVSTLAKNGKTGDWVIDPVDFNINSGNAAQTFNSIGADTLSSMLGSSNVSITTTNFGWSEAGDINVNSSVAWNANTKLTLNADRDINFKDNVYVDGESGGLALNFGRRVNVLDGNSVKLNGASSTYSENGKAFEVLRTAADLNQLSGSVSNKYFVLGGDIDATVISAWNGGLGYNPNADIMNSFFTSTFNGLGNTISNFYVNRPGQDYIGLFGSVKSSTISNLNITGQVTGNDNVGLVAGYIHSGSVYNITANGKATGHDNTGLAIGNAYSTELISNIRVTGEVKGNDSTGGAIGWAYANDEVSEIVSSVAVSGNRAVGGVIGYTYSNDLIKNLTYQGSAKAIDIHGTDRNVGGVIGESFSDTTISGLHTQFSTIKGESWSTGGSIGNVSNAESISDVEVFGFVNGVGSTGGAFGSVDTVQDINHVRSAAVVTGTDNVGGLIGRGNMLTLKEVYAVGHVTGSGSNVGGLAGSLTYSDVTNGASKGNVNGNTNVGGLVGLTDNTHAIESFSTSETTGVSTVGGLVGNVTSGSFTDSYASGKVVGTNLASGIGGFVGESNSSSYAFSYASGAVQAASASTGGFAGLSAGDSYMEVLWDVGSTGQAASSGGATGMTTSQMMNNINFNWWKLDTWGGDSASPWKMDVGYTRPMLKFAMSDLEVEGNQVTTTYNGANQSFDRWDMYTIKNEAYDSFYDLFSSPFITVISGGDIASAKNAGTYSPTDMYGSQFGYNVIVTGAPATLTVEKAKLTFDAEVGDKVYDGTTDAFGVDLKLNGVVGSDSIDIWNYSAEFSDKNAGANKNVEFYGILLGGTGLSNYTYDTSFDMTANISKADLTVTATGVGKTYDGSTAGVANLSGNHFGFDDVQFTGTAAFADKNAGAGKVMTVTDIQLTGDDAANYNLVSTSTSTTATINKANLVVNASGNDKVYDGLTDASVTLSDNRIAGDVFSLTADASFADKNAGASKAVNVGSINATGSDADNYVWNTTATTTADIDKANLVISATGVDKVYDGSKSASALVSDNRVAGDDLVINYNAAFADKNAGSGKLVNLNDLVVTGADAANYNVSSTVTTTANIDKATLAITANGIDKVYDGARNASVSLSDNRINGDALNIGYTASFGDKNAGSNKNVSVGGITLSGADAANYEIGSVGGTKADIKQASLVVEAGSSTKVNGSADGNFTWSLKDGQLYGDDAITGALSRTAGESEGTYAIGNGTLSAGSNYKLSVIPGEFVITKPATNPGLDQAKEIVSVVSKVTASSPGGVTPTKSQSTTIIGDYRLINLGIKLPDDLTADDSPKS